MLPPPSRSTLFPYTTLFRSGLPVRPQERSSDAPGASPARRVGRHTRSEEHTSELQSRPHLVCRLLLEKINERSVASDVGDHTLVQAAQRPKLDLVARVGQEA